MKHALKQLRYIFEVIYETPRYIYTGPNEHGGDGGPTGLQHHGELQDHQRRQDQH